MLAQPRIDGRDPEMIRALDVSDRPSSTYTRFSTMFTRGETQAIVVATLGTERDAQMIDELQGKSYKQSLHASLQLPSILCW